MIDEYNIYGIYQEYFEGLGLEKEYTEEYWEFPLFKDYAEYLIVPHYVCEVGNYAEMQAGNWRSCEVYNEKADSMVYNLEDLLSEGTKFQYSDLCWRYLCGLEEVEFDRKGYLSSKTWLPIPSYFYINGNRLDVDNDDPDKETFGNGVGYWKEELETEGVTHSYRIQYYPIWDETYLTITDSFKYYDEKNDYYNYLYFGKLKK